MGTLLGQLPFPGAGGEGSAAGRGGSDPRRCQERLDVWLPLPLLGIAKPLPRGTAGSWQGGTGHGAPSQPEILAGGHLPFSPGCVWCQRQAQPRRVSLQLPMPCAGREPDLPTSWCWHREPSGAQPVREPRNLLQARGSPEEQGRREALCGILQFAGT